MDSKTPGEIDTQQKQKARYDAAVAGWLRQWGQDDPRTQAYEQFGVIVRRPCAAKVLVEAQSYAGPEGWRDNTAFSLAHALRADMPWEVVEQVVSAWNAGLALPMDDSEVRSILNSAPKYDSAVSCEDPMLRASCVEDQEECDYYIQYVHDPPHPPSSFDTLVFHHLLDGPKPVDFMVYGAIGQMELNTGIDPRKVLFASSRALGAIARVDKNTVGKSLERLEAAGLIEIVSTGDAAKGNAYGIRRILPIPLSVNDALSSNAGSPTSRPKVPSDPDRRERDEFRSKVLAYYLINFTESLSNTCLAYLHERGLSDDTIKRFGLRVQPTSVYKQVTPALIDHFGPDVFSHSRLPKDFHTGFYKANLIIPWYEDGKLVFLKGRNISSTDSGTKYRNMKVSYHGAMPEGFNLDSLSAASTVFICEGEFDTMSIAQLGYAAVGIAGAREPGMTVMDRLSGKSVVLAFDTDEAGKRAHYASQGLLNMRCIPYTELALPEGRDVNDLLAHDPEDLRRRLEEASK